MQRVKVSRGDRIVFVIVAAGAGHGHAHQPARHHVDAVVDDLVGASAENAVPRSDSRAPPASGSSSFEPHLVGRKLLANELIVGLVGIEGPHHVIAIRPRKGITQIRLRKESLACLHTAPDRASSVPSARRSAARPTAHLPSPSPPHPRPWQTAARTAPSLPSPAAGRSDRNAAACSSVRASARGRALQAFGFESCRDHGVDGRRPIIGATPPSLSARVEKTNAWPPS